MAKAKAKAKKEKQERKRKRQREASQRYRNKLKKDSHAYAIHKEIDRNRKTKAKEEGKLKSINELSYRSQRATRAKWREYEARYRQKQKEAAMAGMADNEAELLDATLETSASQRPPLPAECDLLVQEVTPPQPSTSTAGKGPNSRSRQREQGRKAVRRDRAKVYKRNKQLEEKVSAMQRKIWKLQKKLAKKKKSESPSKLTPKHNIARISKGQFLSENVKRNLFKGLVVIEECKRAKDKLTTNKMKTAYARIFSGKVIKKYRKLRECKDILSRISTLKGRKWEKSDKTDNELDVQFKTSKQVLGKREAIVKFFVSSEASYFTPGKKDCIKVKGKTVQKQYRPKFVVPPKLSGRDTCLCVKCENFKLLVKGLKTANVVSEKNKDDILRATCCDIKNEKCLFRTCQLCVHKTVSFNVVDPAEKIVYEQWGQVNVENKSKPGSTTRVTQKETKENCTGETVKLFQSYMPDYMAHLASIIHQNDSLKTLENNLTEEDLLFCVDWSENWLCKYSRQIQSAFFGASQKQLALHTGIVKGKTYAETFCTVSEELDHGPQGIFAHMKPICSKYVSEKIKHVHFQSDGPTTQYRNRKMFKVVARDMSALMPHVETITWNFSESGHGKGIPDGVGGTLKRTADSLVAHGADIRGASTFVSELTKKCSNIFIRLISSFESAQGKKLEVENTKTFQGTFKVHQYH